MKRKTFSLLGRELPFLAGLALGRKLSELADTANRNHRETVNAWRGALEYAREAGQALLEAKKRLGGRGKWGQWRRERFDASAETARVYMRIARKWDDPRIVDARNSGINVTSINSYLKLLRGEPLNPSGKKLPDELDTRRSLILQQFADAVKLLREEELEILGENFNPFWETWYGELQKTVCGALGFDPYEMGPRGAERRHENDEKKKRARKQRQTKISADDEKTRPH